jgi:hypothetical protein
LTTEPWSSLEEEADITTEEEDGTAHSILAPKEKLT